MKIRASFRQWVNIASGNGLVPSGRRPLPEPMLTKFYDTIWRPLTTITMCWQILMGPNQCSDGDRSPSGSTLQWRNSERDGVSNQRRLDCSTVCSGADQRKHQNPAHHWPLWGESTGDRWFPHKGPVTRKVFPFDDVIMRNVPPFFSSDCCTIIKYLREHYEFIYNR